MKLQAFVLLLVVLYVSAGKRHRGLNPMPQPEGPCDVVQPFDQDFVYTYKYIAYTEHRDEYSRQGTDIKISCTATITVPRRCSGKLRVSKCTVEEGTMAADGRMTYRVLPSSVNFDRDMGVSEMAFHFNGGQITRIFLDKMERTNITNFKRGILSSLQAYNPELPKEFEIGDVFEIPRVSVYGQGVVEHKILEKAAGFPSVVEVTRDTSRIELPWERRQWNFIRMRNNRLNPLLSAFKNYITITNEDKWARARQSCRYTLSRGRQVSSARCEERYPLNAIKPEIATKILEGGTLETTIRQEVDLTGSRKMTSADRSQWDVTRFDEDNIMFEEEWEETNMVYTAGFDAATAFVTLVREPVNDKSPALVSKLSRWLAISSQEEIEKVWAKCEKECEAGQKTEGRILYAELLNSCITNDWCQIPYCSSENSTTCENALDSFIRTTTDESSEVKGACLASLESIYAPSVKIVDAALRICRSEERPTPACVRTLGTVTKNFLATCEGEECLNKKPVENAKVFLVRQLKKNCQTNNEEIEEVMATAVEMISNLGPAGGYAAETVLTCAVNIAAPSRVAIKALVAYGNVTGEKVRTEALTKLITVFKNREARPETRITCFHMLMKKNLPEPELEKILTTVMDENEHRALTTHCREDLRTQLLLRGTMFCRFHPDAAERCVKCIVKNRWDIGIARKALLTKPVEKNFEMTREVFLPYFNTATDCTVKINSVYENGGAIVPIMSRLTVEATVEGRNITIMEAALDIAGMKPILDRIFGHNTFYAELFGKLLKTPLYELHGYAKQYPAMNALKMEGKYSYILNIFDTKSPLYLKVLGYEISLDALMGYESIRQMTLGNFWKIVEVLEDGIEHDAFVAGQPFLMQHATPTCIGAPVISTVEVSYILKNRLNLKANLRKMLFSPNEKATINIAPELHLTGSMRRTVLEQFSASCGTELKFKLGHGSAVECSADTNPEGLNAVCKPKPGKSQILYLSVGRSLTASEASKPTESVCVDYNMRGLCTLRLCSEPFSEAGFSYEAYIENEMDTEYRANFAWQARPEEGGTKLMKEFKTEWVAAHRSDPSVKKVIWSSIVSYIPSKNELHCNINCAWFKWRGAANLMVPYMGSSGVFGSFNASGVDSLEFKYYNVFKVTPASEKKYVIEGESKWTNARNEFIGYGIIGAVEEATEGPNTTRKASISLTNLAKRSENLFEVNVMSKKVPEGRKGMPGYETSCIFSGPLLPYYHTYAIEMLTYDNDVVYDKVMKMSGHFENEGRNPHFFVHRINGKWRKPETEAYNAEMHCVSNWFHYEYISACNNEGDTEVRSRVHFPENAIPYNEVVYGKNPFEYNVMSYTRPIASYIELNYTTATLKNKDRDHEVRVGYRMWHPVRQSYYYESGNAKYTNHYECKYCHSFYVEHPKMKLTSVSRGISGRYHDEKWLKLHYSLLNYINLTPFASYYLINNLRNEYAEIGYKIIGMKKEGGVERGEVSATLLRNTANCSLEYDGNLHDIRTECLVNAPVIPLRFNIGVNATNLEENRPVVTVLCDAEYAGVGCRVEGLLKLTRYNNFKCHWNATYGRVPSYEYESILDLSFVDVESQYDITGLYKSTNKRLDYSETYIYTGISNKTERGKRDLELKAMCPSNTKKVCARVTVNKGEKWIEYEKLAAEDEYDRASIEYKNDYFMLETRMVNEIIWGVRRVNLSLELGDSSYGFGIVSPICNITCRYDENTGFKATSNFSAVWLNYRMMVMANSETAKYNIDWNNVEVGGVRVVNNMTLNYSILNFDKPFDASLTIGTAPRVFECGLRIPDLDFNFEYSRDLEAPRTYQYFCNAKVIPNKIIIKSLKVPVWGRELEMQDTTVGYEYRNNEIYRVYAKNMNVKLSPPCRGLAPMIVNGECDFSYEKLLFKMSDTKRSFVIDAALDLTIPMNHHVEFVMSVMNTKMEFLWDMKNVENKYMMNGKCQISMVSWETKMMKPVFTIMTMNEIAPTPESANFPIMDLMIRMNHSLHLNFISSEMEMSVKSAWDGKATTIDWLTRYSRNTWDRMIFTLNGCHRRFEIMPGFSMCWPNDMGITLPFEWLGMNGHDSYNITKENNEWVFKGVSKYICPTLNNEWEQMTLNFRVATTGCLPTENWCAPNRIHFKDVELVVPSTIGKWLNLVLPSIFTSTEYTDLRIEHGELLLSRELVGEKSISSISTGYQKTGTNEEIKMTISAEISPEKIVCNIDVKAAEWTLKHDVEAKCDPETWAWEYKHVLECPWVTSNIAMEASSPLTIASCDTTIKMPNGIIRDFNLKYGSNKLSCNAELAFGKSTGTTSTTVTWNPATMEWEFTNTIKCPWMNSNMAMKGRSMMVKSCDFTFKSKGMVNEITIHFGEENGFGRCSIGTVEFELKKERREWTWNMKCGRYPWMNHTFFLRTAEEGRLTNWNTRHETNYYTCVTSFSTKGYNVYIKQVDCRMNNSQAGFKVEYINENEGSRCRIAFRSYDNTGIACLTTPMASESTDGRLECRKLEGSKSTKFASIPVTMRDFPFMGNYLVRDKLLFLARCVQFCYKAINYDEKTLMLDFQKNIECTDGKICQYLAKKVKYAHYACVKEMKRIAGAKMVYFTKPEIMGYAIYNTFTYIPGSMTIMPNWNSLVKYSPAEYVKAAFRGDEISLIHWSFQPYFEIKAGMRLETEDEFVILAESASEKYPWLNAAVAVGTGEVEGRRLINVTTEVFGSKDVMILGTAGGRVYVSQNEFCTDDCRKRIISNYNWTLNADGRRNFTFMMAGERGVQFVCDVLSLPSDWKNTEIRCFEGRNRGRLIGKLNFPDVPSYDSYDYADIDKALIEILHMKSENHRHKIVAGLKQYTMAATNYAEKYWQTGRKYGMLARSAQYTIAHIMHEASKYTGTQQVYGIASRFYNRLYNLNPNFWGTYEEFVNYFARVDVAEGLAMFVQNLLNPWMDTLGYALEGNVAAKWEVKDNVITLRTTVDSTRFPIWNFNTTLRISRESWDNIKMNITTANRFTTIMADARLVGPRLMIDRVRFGLPEMDKEFLEVRFNAEGPFAADMFFADSAGQNYGCRGGRTSPTSRIVHVHCFQTKGPELPPNPPASSIVAYWDVEALELPYASHKVIAAVFRSSITLLRTIYACYEDPATLDRTLMQVYHVHDAKVRQRLTSTISATCRRWVDEFTLKTRSSFVRRNENEQKIVAMTRMFKTYSYDSLMSSATEALTAPGADIYVWDFTAIADLTTMAYACAPVINYVVAMVEYMEPAGVFNISRCTRCRTTMGETRLMMAMTNPRFPALDYETVVTASSEGLINASIINNCAWGWVESELSAWQILPRKGKFGLANNMDGIEVVFWPEVRTGPPPTMSLFFNLEERYCCDTRMETLLSTSVRCYPFKAGERGAEVATCEINPVKTLSACAEMVYETGLSEGPSSARITRELRKSCAIKDSATEERVANKIASNMKFLADYFRKEITNYMKACGDLLNATYSHLWKAFVDSYTWWTELLTTAKKISLRRYFSTMRDGVEVFLGWCEDVTFGMNNGIELFYEAGDLLNEMVYNLPSYLPSAEGYKEYIPKYYHIYWSYIKMWGMGMVTKDNCMCGMVSVNNMEQAITFNNHMYNLPKRVTKCPYLLAGDVSEEKFTVVLMKNDLVINLPEISITIDPNMRVFKARRGVRERTEVTLPHFDGEVSCIRYERDMYCVTPHVTVVVHCTNNVRTSFYMKVAEKRCTNTRGLMGIGGNTTEVPEMVLINGTAAASMEEFINSYSIEKTCRIGKIPVGPEASHEHCDAMFENESWMKYCPNRRRSVLLACQTGATSAAEACRYAEELNRMCGIEGRLVALPPQCGICGGKAVSEHIINKVHVTVVMSLSRKTNTETLPQIMEAVRQMANSRNINYEVSFVTFGGRGDKFTPAFYVTGGKVSIPATEAWNMPAVTFDGPSPTYDSVKDAMWFAYTNWRSAVEGVGKIILFVVPEDVDFEVFAPSTCALLMREDMATSYMLIPTFCERMGAKTRATMGVRQLFTHTPSAGMCKRSPIEVASVIAYPHINKKITCTCKVLNPFTGQATNECHPVA